MKQIQTIIDNGEVVAVVETKAEGAPDTRIAELEARLKEAEAERDNCSKTVIELYGSSFCDTHSEKVKQTSFPVFQQWMREMGCQACASEKLTAAEARAEAAEKRIKTLEARLKEAEALRISYLMRAEKAEADAGRLKEANTRMHEDIEALENVADLRRIALEQVEYHQAYTLSCPWCFSLQESGHKPDCARQAALSPAATDEQQEGEPKTKTFDLVRHLHRQRVFSLTTFGYGKRTAGIIDHIRRELIEIEQNPDDKTEWADLALLTFDGAWRHGIEPEDFAKAIDAKQTVNEGRTWPDWRTADPDKAIEHVRPAAEQPAPRDVSGEVKE